MANFASALKSEILRLARKEVRGEVDGLRNVATQQRKVISELRRRVESLEKQLVGIRIKISKYAEPSKPQEGASPLRFNAKGFASHRKRLGLSAAEAGALIGVSAQTIYGWEKKETKPRGKQMEAIAAFRSMGKREAKASLAKSEP